MKYFCICLIENKLNEKITVRDQYLSKEDATKNLERIALEYVKDKQGTQQQEVCKQNKTKEQLVADSNLKEGL